MSSRHKGGDMDNLFSNYNLERFQIKKPAKNEERKRLISELSDASGWSKKSIHFKTLGLPDSWLQDALNECRYFSNPKLRNKKLSEFLNGMRS